MKHAFNAADAAEIVTRLESLRPEARGQWGKMNVAQMLAHCNASLETAMRLDNPRPLPLFLRLIGRMMKKSMFGAKPFPKNSATDKSYLRSGEHDFETERAKVVRQFKAFAAGGPEQCPERKHVFFGTLQPQEWAIMQWKHFDHHLRQFGA